MSQFEHAVDLFRIEPFRVVYVAVGARNRHDAGSQLGRFQRDSPCHVAESGDGDPLALQRIARVGEHLPDEIDGAEPGRLGPHERAAEGHALAGQHARILPGQLAVHAVQVADLASSDADVAGRHVGLGAYVTPQLGHEGLAETHDLRIGLAARVEVRASLGAAHRQHRQRVLENLFEAQKLQNAQVDARVEPQASLVRPERVVELDAVADVDLNVSPVVDPRDLEREDPVRLDDPLGDPQLLEFGMPVVDRFDRQQHFAYRLQILAFPRVSALEFGQKLIDVHGSKVLSRSQI